MEITLYMATSIDGFIATKDGDSDWVSDADVAIFDQHIQEKGCIILGRNTFEQYISDLYPVKGVTNIVLSTTSPTYTFDNVFVAQNPAEAVALAKEKGHTEALLIGGGKTNAAFLQAGLIDNVILSIHPLILQDGIRLFEGAEHAVTLESTGIKELGEGLVHVYYDVKR